MSRAEELAFQRDNSMKKVGAREEQEREIQGGVHRAVALVKLGGPVGSLALSVGSRDRIELELLSRTWGCRVVGVDLFATDPRMVLADMGRLPFLQSVFDAVVSCHSLEHSFDPVEALLEMFRVVRVGGQVFIEVPISPHSEGVPLRFPSGADRWNFGNMGALKLALPACARPVAWKETDRALQLVAVRT